MRRADRCASAAARALSLAWKPERRCIAWCECHRVDEARAIGRCTPGEFDAKEC
jgi:hypothetical protein